MPHNFLETTLGDTGLNVHRLGLSASYWPGKKTIYKAIDKGVNYFFGYGFDYQMISVLRDVYMIRYNAAHRGAEHDIFPHLTAYNPGVVSYTATRWSYLIRRNKKWPKSRPIPTPGLCYRFVLSNPHVHVCMTAPANTWQFEENIGEVRKGPLNEEELSFVKEYGDLVRHTKKWFM
jgi:aryl-alcohol dehydrogenase-like predicted oxidoreductase